MHPHDLNCKTSKQKLRNGSRKPNFSQPATRRNLTLGSMPVKHPLPAPLRRTRKTQGIALVVVLLSAMVLTFSSESLLPR